MPDTVKDKQTEARKRKW